MRCALLLSVAVLLLAPLSQAQMLTGMGTVHGIVRDPYNEGLPGADVALTNKTLHVERLMETSLDGLFMAPAVPPGPGYKLEIQRKGFANWDSGEFEVRVGETLVFEVMLGETKAAESTVKTASSVAAEEPSSGPWFILTRSQLQLLPIREFRMENLVAVLPGVTWDPRLADISLRGVATASRTLIDGVSATREVRFASGITPAAIEGVNLANVGYPTEVGNSLGAVASIASRSGTPEYHGSAYGYLLNRSLGALPTFGMGHNLGNNGTLAGLNFGGPLRGEKSFVFANVENRNLRAYSLNRITDPLLAGSGGTSVASANCTATAAQCQAATALIQSRMNVLVPQSSGSNSALVRIDWHPSQWNSFRVSAQEQHERWPAGMETGVVAANGGALGRLGMKSMTRVVKIGWTASVGASGSNELSFGAYRTRLHSASDSTGLSTGSVGITVAGVTIGAPDPFKTSIRKWRRNELTEKINFVAGAHRLQFGINWAQSPTWFNELNDGAGHYTYASLTDFALDITGSAKNYLTFTQTLGNAGRRFRHKEVDIYFQDTWRPIPTLTVSYGVRWEKESQPQPQAVDSYYFRTSQIISRAVNFSPRIGVAYKVSERITARVGVGSFYAPFSTTLIDTLTQGHGKYTPSIVVAKTSATGPKFPNVVTGVGTIPTGSKVLAYGNSRFRNPWSPQVSLSLERDFGYGFLVSASYMASPGRQLLTSRDMNINETATTRTYSILNASGTKSGDFETLMWTSKTSSSLGRVWEVRNDGSSTYHAAILRIAKAMSRTFGMETTYTWSRARGNVGGPWVLSGVPLSTYNGSPDKDLGVANTDQRQRVVSVWTFRPDFSRSSSANIRRLADGWQFSAIATFATALPATTTVQTLGQQFATASGGNAAITMPWLMAINGSGLWNRVPFDDVNSLRLGEERNINVRVARSVPFSKRITGVFGVEVFNLFDNQFTTDVNKVAYSAVAGVLKPVSGTGTAIAASAPRSAQASFRVEF